MKHIEAKHIKAKHIKAMWWPLLLVTSAELAFGLACSSSPGQGASDAHPTVDADPNQPDAEPFNCAEASLTIGGCKLSPGGEPCTGALDSAVFVELAQSDPMQVVVGPQGSDMIVFALRTSGIEPGDVANPASRDRPNVKMHLVRDSDESMGKYRGRPSFVPSPAAPADLEALGVFLVVDNTIRPGDSLRVQAQVEDKNGELRCGTLTFRAAF